jgi:hypothetical protein
MYYTSNYIDRNYYTPIILASEASNLIINYVYSLYSSATSSVSYLATGSNSRINNNIIYSSNGSNWSPSINTGLGGSSIFFSKAGYGISINSENEFVVVGDDNTSTSNLFISSDYTGSNFRSMGLGNLNNAPLYDIQNINRLQSDPNVQYGENTNNTFILTSRTNNTIYIIENVRSTYNLAIDIRQSLYTEASPNRTALFINVQDIATFLVYSPNTQYVSPTAKGYSGIHVSENQTGSNGDITGITFGTSFTGGTLLENPTTAGILTTGDTNDGPGTVLHIMNSKNITFLVIFLFLKDSFNALLR